MPESILTLPSGPRLDLEADRLLFNGYSPTGNGLPASRAWSIDSAAVHGLYDPLAQEKDWCLGFSISGTPRGWIVLDPQGKLVANARTSILAMLRAVLASRLENSPAGNAESPVSPENEIERRRPGRPRKAVHP